MQKHPKARPANGPGNKVKAGNTAIEPMTLSPLQKVIPESDTSPLERFVRIIFVDSEVIIIHFNHVANLCSLLNPFLLSVQSLVVSVLRAYALNL